jgi:hypothetical protein
MFSYFINLFYKSRAGECWLRFNLWLEERRLEQARKDFSKVKPTALVVKKQELIVEGINKIKRIINSKVKTGSKEEYSQILTDIFELSQLAISIEDPKYIKQLETIKKAFIYKGTDVKTEADKTHMIDQRIKAFEELRKSNELRKKARSERH